MHYDKTKPLSTELVAPILRTEHDLRKTMSEAEFYRKYLATLYAYHKGDESIDINYWLTSANISVYEEIDLIDANGEVVLTVPSLLIFTDGRIAPKEVTSEAMGIFTKAHDAEKAIPGSGRKVVERELTQHLYEFNDERLAAHNQWDKIFIRYGLEPLYGTVPSTYKEVENTGDVKTEQTVPDAPDEDDFL